MMTREQLLAADEDVLFREMDRAYGSQAWVVDNCGSDDDSYAAERRCEMIESVIESRGLTDKYDRRSE